MNIREGSLDNPRIFTQRPFASVLATRPQLRRSGGADCGVLTTTTTTHRREIPFEEQFTAGQEEKKSVRPLPIFQEFLLVFDPLLTGKRDC